MRPDGRRPGAAARHGVDPSSVDPGEVDPGSGDPTVRLAAVPNRRERLAAQRAQERARARKRRNVAVLVVAAVLLVGGVLGGGYYLYTSFIAVPDFDGPGTGDVLVQVHDGDSTTQIGEELAGSGVVKDPRAFTRAASDDERVRALQPGWYQLRSQMSGTAAVALMLDPAARVGQLDVRGGVQLDDTKAPDGATTPGVLSQVSAATCHAVDGKKQCVSVDELRKAMSTTDPATLGVPSWAVAAVGKAPPERRLEGLIVPGRYDVQPGTSAVDVLTSLMTRSAARFSAAGLVTGAQKIGMDPYEVLVIASLVEKESITADMPKVSRVIYNRLGAGQRLELDTTINYPLDVPSLYTSPANRAKAGPYNTYLNAGLPITPIAAVGTDSLAAALAPAQGPWMFFVPCDKDGTSCFAITFAEHTANVAKAHANGVF